nr:hypothetical protein [Tanacetum cinerariifolium]
ASRFPTPPLAYAFFSPEAIVTCGEPLYGFLPCRWSTCERCGIDLVNGFCPLCNSRNSCAYDPNLNSFACPPDSYHPLHPTHKTYSSDSCGINSHLGYDCPPQFPLNYEPEPGYIQNYNSYPHDSPSLPQQCLCCDNCGGLHETFQCQPMNQNFYNSNSLGFIFSLGRVFKIKDALRTKQYKPEDIQDLFRQLSNDVQNIHEELAEYINTPGWNCPAFYDDDDDDDDVDYTIAIIHVLSTEEPIDSLSVRDKHLDTISTMESDEVIKSSVENLVPILSESEGIPEHKSDVPFHDNSPPLDVSKDQFEDFSESNDEFSSINDDSFSIDNIDYGEASSPDSELVSSEVMEIVIPEVGGIDDDILLTIKDDNLREKLLNVNLLIATIEALNDNPTPSSNCKTKSPSTSLNSFLEETNTFHNSLPEFKNFCFDLEEISSGIPLLILIYLFRIIKLSISMTIIFNRLVFPPTDRSDFTHEEFADELAHIISLPEYDCFYFRDLPDPGELISIFNSEICENLSSTTCVNLPIEDDHFPLLAYVVWIFLAYLTYPVIPPYLHPFGNEDTIFDPGITINRFCLFKPGLSHRCGAFKKFNTHHDYDSERDILVLEELFDNYSLSFPVIESYHFDIPSFSHPPAKPPDGNTRILNVKMMGDISDQKVPMHQLMITLILNQEKSSDLLSHQGLEIF